MKIIGYARTTINDHDLDTQIDALSSFGCQEIIQETYIDSTSPSHFEKLEALLTQLTFGDTLVIAQLHRLGKTTRQFSELTEKFKKEKIHLVSIDDQIDTRTPAGKLYFQVMDSLATMEGTLIKERTLIGLTQARQKGKIGGRPKINLKTIKKIRRLYYEKKESIQVISTKCNVSIGSCYKYINMTEEDILKLVK